MSFSRFFHVALAFLAVFSASGNVVPEALSPAPAPTLATGGAAQEVDLRTVFRDPDVPGSAVRVSVRLGAVTKSFHIALYDQQTPITVTNFLAYVTSGRHNKNFIHRSVPGFVVQGGGFIWDSTGVNPVPTYAPIQNEPGISNVRGTVAMAKLGGDPNSATSQWFVNLADNSANLDEQNGGFTVFGNVIGNGMEVVDEIAALPYYNAGGAFTQLPLKGYTSGSVQATHVVETNSAVVPALTFAASSSDPTLVQVAVNGSTLQLIPSATRIGTASVGINATDIEGATTQTNLTVTVRAPWTVQPGPDGQPSILARDSFTGNVAGASVPVSFGEIKQGKSASRTFTVRNDSESPFTGLTLTGNALGEGFVISSGLEKDTLAPGESTTFSVTFAPTSLGTRSGVIRVAGANASEAALELQLSGTGVILPPPVLTSLSPQTLNVRSPRTAVVPDWRGTLVTATDPEGVSSFEQTPAPGTVLPIGTYPLKFTARNTFDKESSVETTLTVRFEPVNVTAGYGGAPVPEDGGADLPANSVLTVFGTPAISDNGELASTVTIASGRKKLAAIYWENESGARKLVARQNQSAGIPEVANALFKSFRDPVLAPGGAIAFTAKLTGVKASEDEGIWTNLFGTLEPVLREGAEVPGLGGLKLKSVTSLSLTDDALLALVKLMPSPGLVKAGSDTALVRITGRDSGVLLARTGTGFDNSTIKMLSVLQPASGSAGQGRWHGATETIAKLTLSDKRTVVVRFEADGTPAKLLQAGQDDPNLGVKLTKLGLPALGEPAAAVLVTEAKGSDVDSSNDTVLLYAGDGTSFEEVIREDDLANVPSEARFAGFSDPVVNTQGEMLFLGTLRGEGIKSSNRTGLWRIDAETGLKVIAQAGSPATDKEGNVLENTAWSAFSSYALLDGEQGGPVFLAQLSGKAVKPQTKLGLWSVDANGSVRQLIRTGEEITLPDGKKRLTGLKLLNSLPGSFGVRRSYNATGSVAVHATFHDKSQAILRLDLP